MDRRQLLPLDRLAHLSPAAIAAQDAALGSLLVDRLGRPFNKCYH